MITLRTCFTATVLTLIIAPAAAAQWQVSAVVTNLQIDRASSSPPRDRQIVGIVLSVLDESGNPVSGLKEGAFDLRAQTCAPNPSVTASNKCRLGKRLTLVLVRELEVTGTYFLQSEDTYGNAPDEVLSQGVVVLRVYQPAVPRANQPARLRSQLVLTKSK